MEQQDDEGGGHADHDGDEDGGQEVKMFLRILCSLLFSSLTTKGSQDPRGSEQRGLPGLEVGITFG